MTTRVAISDRPDVTPSTVEDTVARVAYVRDTARKGDPGDDGREVELHVAADAIEWRYVGDLEWAELVLLSAITGADGREVELQQTATHIQWRHAGDLAWADLVPLSDITGPRGIPGREVELAKSATHVQWRYADDVDWTDLVPLADITGSAGDDGRALELATSATHVQWRLAGDPDWVDLVPLAAITGPKGDDAYQVAVAGGFVGTRAEWLASLDGQPGADSTVPGPSAYEAAVAGGFVGTEAEWLASLVGPAGDPGPSAYDAAVAGGFVGTELEWLASLVGDDGREVELQKSDTAVQWRYLGDTDWTDLVPLSDITGPPGGGGSGDYSPSAMYAGPWDSGASYVTGTLVTYEGAVWEAITPQVGVVPGTPPAISYVGGPGSLGGGFGPDASQQITPLASGTYSRVRAAFNTAGTFRVGYSLTRPTSSSITWLAYADITVTADTRNTYLAADLNVPLELTAGSPVWMVAYTTAAGGSAAVNAVQAGQPVGCTVGPAYYQWNSTLAGYVLCIQLISDVVEFWNKALDLPQATPAPARSTATITTASLAAGAQETGAVQLAAGYRVYQLATDRPARVRLYATAAQRDADAARALGTDPTGDHGLMLEFATTAGTLSAALSPLVDGFDGKVTPDGLVPYTIDNLDTAAGSVSCTFTYLRTE